MREKHYGILFYNSSNERIDVVYDDGTTEGGLHCGQTLEVFLNNEWIQTRLEMGKDWFLDGIKGLESLVGLKVKL